MLKDFKAFILRGNVVDMAIGIAIGAAFTALVTSFTTNILTPIIAIPGTAADFDAYTFTIAGSTFRYGRFINSMIAFIIVLAALFFFVVKPVNALMARRKTEPEVDSKVRECPECLSSIPVGARRCAFCTAEVAAI